MTDPAAILAGIQHHHRQHVSQNFPAPGICVSRCTDRWPCQAYRAAAAALAALKLADEWAAESDELDGLAEKPGTDEEGRPVMQGEAIGYHTCALELREAITRELTGGG